MRRLLLPIIVVLAAAGSGTSSSAAELSLEDPFPVAGTEQLVRINDVEHPEHLSLRVVYLPNSKTQHQEMIGSFSAEGELRWRPAGPGIATLAAVTESGEELVQSNVAICFPSTPGLGVAVLVLAGLLLFGGAGFSLRLALR